MIYVKAKIDKTQHNSECRLCGDRDKMINHIISKCSKLAQKEYETTHDAVRKVIQWELWKKFKFNNKNNAQPRISGILRYKLIGLTRPDDQT